MKPKQEKIFDASVWLFVIAAHTVGLSAMWQSKSAEVTVGVSVLEIVDLGNFQAGVAEQSEPPAAEVKPVLPEKTKPIKPIKPIEKKIVAVKKPNQKADVVVKKEEIKPETKPEPQKPVAEENIHKKRLNRLKKTVQTKVLGRDIQEKILVEMLVLMDRVFVKVARLRLHKHRISVDICIILNHLIHNVLLKTVKKVLCVCVCVWKQMVVRQKWTW